MRNKKCLYEKKEKRIKKLLVTQKKIGWDGFLRKWIIAKNKNNIKISTKKKQFNKKNEQTEKMRYNKDKIREIMCFAHKGEQLFFIWSQKPAKIIIK